MTAFANKLTTPLVLDFGRHMEGEDAGLAAFLRAFSLTECNILMMVLRRAEVGWSACVCLLVSVWQYMSVYLYVCTSVCLYVCL